MGQYALQGLNRPILTVVVISDPTASLEPTIGTTSLVVNLYGRQKHSRKIKQLSLASAWRQ